MMTYRTAVHMCSGICSGSLWKRSPTSLPFFDTSNKPIKTRQLSVIAAGFWALKNLCIWNLTDASPTWPHFPARAAFPNQKDACGPYHAVLVEPVLVSVERNHRRTWTNRCHQSILGSLRWRTIGQLAIAGPKRLSPSAWSNTFPLTDESRVTIILFLWITNRFRGRFETFQGNMAHASLRGPSHWPSRRRDADQNIPLWHIHTEPDRTAIQASLASHRTQTRHTARRFPCLIRRHCPRIVDHRTDGEVFDLHAHVSMKVSSRTSFFSSL